MYFINLIFHLLDGVIDDLNLTVNGWGGFPQRLAAAAERLADQVQQCLGA